MFYNLNGLKDDKYCFCCTAQQDKWRLEKTFAYQGVTLQVNGARKDQFETFDVDYWDTFASFSSIFII